ncbi:uncharacterized protein LOC118823777 [Colossoma macropomum]|uniref:uncharacterized protein LOC118823777 n=1 Tax=Colossoma macropomum TaxID=42526 RepID=UPI0018640F71|nr:uncharacterized protein LOC118823777 [Colossoma macropomum]
MAVAPCMSTGVSLAGTSIEEITQDMDTGRNVTIVIFNYSEKYILANPRHYSSSGYCHRPPQPTIEKQEADVCCFSKTPHSARGSGGVLTYQILSNGNDCVGELAIMFSVPYDDLYQNYFGLGIFQPGVSCDQRLFEQMYYEQGPFTRGAGKQTVLTYSDEDAFVRGTMSRCQSIMTIEFCNDETVQTDQSVMETEFHSEKSVQIDQSVMKTEFYSDESIKADQSVMKTEFYSDESIKADQSVMKTEFYSDESVKTDQSVMETEFYSDESVKTDQSVMETEFHSEESVQIDQSVMKTEFYSDENIKADQSVMKTEFYSDESIKTDQSVMKAEFCVPVETKKKKTTGCCWCLWGSFKGEN